MFATIGILFFLTITCINGLSLPPEFEKCERADPKLNECLKSAVQSALSVLAKGLPEFNFESIEPIKIPSMTIGEGTGAVHVVQNYKNAEVHNISSAKVENVE